MSRPDDRNIEAAPARTGIFTTFCAGTLLTVGAALAQQPAIKLELNKLEDRESGCRVYLVVGNEGDARYETLKLDLVMFDTNGVISRRVAVEAGPVRPEKTAVKLFDLAGLPCRDIGQVLVNDVVSCRDAAGEQADCIGRLALASRASVKFTK